jgi:predicted transcriptional regulator
MRYVADMALQNSISVRLDPETRGRLERLATGFGVKSAVLIRQAVEEKIATLEREKSMRLKEGSTRYSQTQNQSQRKKL